MSKTFKTAAIAVALAVAPLAASAQPMGPGFRAEAAMHPRMVSAIRQAEGALAQLQSAPDEFGGRKARAIDDLRRAIHSMRVALFYRMHVDDNAIDSAMF